MWARDRGMASSLGSQLHATVIRAVLGAWLGSLDAAGAQALGRGGRVLGIWPFNVLPLLLVPLLLPVTLIFVLLLGWEGEPVSLWTAPHCPPLPPLLLLTFFSDFFSRRLTCFTFTARFRSTGSRKGASSGSLNHGWEQEGIGH